MYVVVSHYICGGLLEQHRKLIWWDFILKKNTEEKQKIDEKKQHATYMGQEMALFLSSLDKKDKNNAIPLDQLLCSQWTNDQIGF